MSEQFAPIIIPTLNRYEHLKRCVESLENCTGSDKTDLYIGLDYPPSEKYEEGWKKVDSYLQEKEKRHCFKNLIVRRRTTNCGVGHRYDNGNLLLDEVRKVSDCFILTEDDNDFSPNFLEYMNWGLSEYKDDKSIFAICGCQDLQTERLNNNVFKLNNVFCGWGYGSWFDRIDEFYKLFDYNKYWDIVNNTRFCDLLSLKIIKTSSLLYQIAKKTFYGDVMVSLLPDDQKWCVYPKDNKVRNWGHDGSGLHGGTFISFNKYSSLTLDNSTAFKPVIEKDLFNQDVYEIACERFKYPRIKYVKASLNFLTYKLFGRIIIHNNSKWCKVKFIKVQ